MTDKQRDEILLELLEKTKDIDSHFKDIDNHFKDIDDHFKETDSKLNENIRLTRDINRSVAKIEVEYGSKLSALFDAFKVNSEKIDELQEDVKNIRSILDRHEDEIFCLKTNTLNQ